MNFFKNKYTQFTKIFFGITLCYSAQAAELDNEELMRAKVRLTSIVQSLSSNGGPDAAPTMREFSNTFLGLTEIEQLEVAKIFKKDTEEGNLDDIIIAQMLASSCNTREGALAYIAERNRQYGRFF